MKQLLTFLCLIIGFNCIGQASCPTIVSYHTKPIGSGFKVYYTFVNPTNGSKSIELLIKDGSNIVFTTCINASGQQNVLRKDSTAVLAGNPDNMTIQWISHTNGSCGGGVCATSSVNPLPVKLTKFTANVTVSSVNLYWQSEVEDNLAYYEVEKSTNGSDYTLIGRVNGNNRASNYLFKDYYLDSGDPVNIICGYINGVNSRGIPIPSSTNATKEYAEKHPNLDAEHKGVVELLWEAFGGTISDEGYKVLDSHIGVIYGDAITLDRAEEINARLMAKGFATTNIVFGVGSFSLGYATRDQQGCAVKATYCELRLDDQIIKRNIFKDPITDNGIKKSAKGRIIVFKDENGIHQIKDECTDSDMGNSLLKTILLNGKFSNQTTIHDIRKRINKHLTYEPVPAKAV